jgi:hypothetical protein
MAKQLDPPSPQDAAKDLEVADLQEKLQRAEALLRAQASSSPNRGAVEAEALKHPNAFRSQDGRILYKYEFKATNGSTETIVSQKPIEDVSVEEFCDSMPISMFQGQAGRLPQNLTVTGKDPQWAFFWFNKKARDGYRVGEARTQGWVPAKKEDLSAYFVGLNDRDGAVEQYDLVLMKIHKAKLYMMLAEWVLKAKRDGGIEGYKNTATNSVHGGKSKQVTFYHTPQALEEVQGLGRAPNEL